MAHFTPKQAQKLWILAEIMQKVCIYALGHINDPTHQKIWIISHNFNLIKQYARGRIDLYIGSWNMAFSSNLDPYVVISIFWWDVIRRLFDLKIYYWGVQNVMKKISTPVPPRVPKLGTLGTLWRSQGTKKNFSKNFSYKKNQIIFYENFISIK